MPKCAVVLALCVLACGFGARSVHGSECQIRKLGLNPAYHEQWGQAVAVAGNRVLVGVPGRNRPGSWGEAYVFSVVGGQWTTEAAFFPTDIAQPNGFGDSVALDAAGSLALVGAIYDPIPNVIDGSVYAFARSKRQDWIFEVRVSANQPDPDPSRYEFFGSALAIEDQTLLVGAYNDRSAYVFDHDVDGTWTQSARLTPDQGGAQFGWSVALKNDIAVVGAPSDFTQGNYAGAAFVFARDIEGTWMQIARLLPHPGGLQMFGASVATDGDVIMVGAKTDSTLAPSAGAVYVYGRNATGAWEQRQLLFAPNAQNSDFFGVSLAMDGDLALVGAENYAGTFYGYGAVFVFHRGTDGTWTLAGTLTANDPHDGSEFGRAVGLSGHLAIVGAPFQRENGIESAGAAYVFAVGPDNDADGIMDICECRSAGDLDLTGDIGLRDLTLLLSSFEISSGGDLDGDGATSLSDLSRLLAHFGETCR